MEDASDPGFVCRTCDHPLSRRDGALRCRTCTETVPVVDGIPRFPVPAEEPSTENVFDYLAPIYETPVWFSPLYRFVGGPFAPWDDRSRVAAMLEPNGATVLDVACGTGRFTRHVAADAEFVTGIDISGEMLERARRYATRDGIDDVAFARMSADRLWFEEDAFDRVSCCWALHIFPDASAALAEMRRVLQPDGRLAGTTLLQEYAFDVPGVREAARQTIGAEPFAREEFRDLLGEAGFSALEFDRRGAVLFFEAEHG